MSTTFESIYEEIEKKKKERESAFEQLPKGTYIAALVTFNYDENKGSIKWEFEVTSDDHGGKYVGRKLFKNSFVNDQGLQFLLSDLYEFGFKMKDLNDLTSTLESIWNNKPNYSVTLYVAPQKSDPKYNNVYINSVAKITERDDSGIPF